MPRNDYSKDLEVAVAAARAAGKVIMSYFKSSYQVRDKGGTPGEDNPVTSADLAANGVLKEQLLNAYPDDGWLSEETADSRDRLEKRRVWVVDPIDGTKEFILGIPQFCVSVGLSVDGEAALGVLYNPARDEMIAGAAGIAPTLNDRPALPTDTATLSEAVCLASRTECEKGWFDRFTRDGHFSKVEPIGSVAYKLGLIAAGAGDITFSLTPKNEWDIAGGAGILAAGNLPLTDRNGAPIRFNRPDTLLEGCITSNRKLISPLLELLA
ncbi:MAG: 3'(2'),5'-bisphosphate nucleotidase CysQ, partial [Deltaproteobacteria bacterium]|nr:3'(2'),5'-bisphosphate nucleotidase CysQ [Deltaproteobacteria bacterium]